MAVRTPQSKAASQGLSEPTFSSRPSRSYKKTLIVTLVILLLAGLAYYFFTKYHELKTNPDAASQEEATDLASEVGEIMVLPQDEIPTIVTILDPELLAGQAFFKDAKKGDKTLVYSQAGKVILYDPVAKKIINVAPIRGREAGAL